MSSSGDTPFFYIAPPPTLSYCNQQTLGILEIDACGRNAVSCHGDILLDGKITTTDDSSPALFFNGSTLNVSGNVVFNDTVQFLNASTGTGIGLHFSASQPQLHSHPWSVSGTVYVSQVLSALGTGNVNVLCIS